LSQLAVVVAVIGQAAATQQAKAEMEPVLGGKTTTRLRPEALTPLLLAREGPDKCCVKARSEVTPFSLAHALFAAAAETS
jgi:hypothetical protein